MRSAGIGAGLLLRKQVGPSLRWGEGGSSAMLPAGPSPAWRPRLPASSHKSFVTSLKTAFCLTVQHRPVFLGLLAAAICRVAIGSDEGQQGKNHQTIIFLSRSH